MPRKSRGKREMLTFELTPLIDVVFLLLIFFMVSSVFKKEELSLMLSLPKTGEGGQKESKDQSLNIEMNKDKLIVNSKEIELSEVDSVFRTFDSKTLVNLRVDGQVIYDRLVNVLDSLKKNKLENISLITEKKNK